jgi:hypothetical protein
VVFISLLFLSGFNGVFNGTFDLLEEGLALLLVFSLTIRSVVGAAVSISGGGILISGGGGVSGLMSGGTSGYGISSDGLLVNNGGGLSLALSNISGGNVALGEFRSGLSSGLNGGGVVKTSSVSVVSGSNSSEGLFRSFEGSSDSGFKIVVAVVGVFSVSVIFGEGRSLDGFLAVEVEGSTRSDVFSVGEEGVGEGNEVRSVFFFNSEHALDKIESEGRVSVSDLFELFVEEFSIEGTFFEVVKFFNVGESSNGEEGQTEGEDISLIFVSLDFEIALGDLSNKFRGKEGLLALDDGKGETVLALLSSKGGIRELVGGTLDEDVAGSDVTVRETLGLEVRETRDEGVSDLEDFGFSVSVMGSDSFFELGLEGLFEVFNVDGDLVVGGTEVLLILGVVTDNLGNVGMTEFNSVVEEFRFSIESLLSVDDNFLKDQNLFSFLVLDDLDLTVVGVLGLFTDDFNFRSIVGLRGDGLFFGLRGTH